MSYGKEIEKNYTTELMKLCYKLAIANFTRGKRINSTFYCKSTRNNYSYCVYFCCLVEYSINPCNSVTPDTFQERIYNLRYPLFVDENVS